MLAVPTVSRGRRLHGIRTRITKASQRPEECRTCTNESKVGCDVTDHDAVQRRPRLILPHERVGYMNQHDDRARYHTAVLLSACTIIESSEYALQNAAKEDGAEQYSLPLAELDEADQIRWQHTEANIQQRIHSDINDPEGRLFV